MTREDLKLPENTTYQMGLHAGRFASAVIVALIPGVREDKADDRTLVVDEIPNYHYIGSGKIEPMDMTINAWGNLVVSRWHHFAPAKYPTPWVDAETTFSKELRRCKMSLRKNIKHSPELRTQVTKEYFSMGLIQLVPWLNVLPAELYSAKWPEDDRGAAERETGRDFTLSALEHVLSRRPRPKGKAPAVKSSFLENYLKANKRHGSRRGDPHLGAQ